MNKISRAIIFVIFSTVSVISNAQVDSVTLIECQDMAISNYPLIQSADLIKKSGEYSVKNAHTGYLPAITINGQYTLQSDVTELPIEVPNIPIPQIDKEQYKAYVELNQVIYDAGINRNKIKAASAQTLIDESSLNTELYKIKERINELYFGILLTNSQISQIQLLKKDLRAGLDRMQAMYDNGTVLRSNVDAIRAEILKSEQRETDLTAARKYYIKMLSIFINKDLHENTVLEIPQNVTIKQEIVRPELDLFTARMRSIDIQTSMINSKNLPKVNAFAQGGYGSPGLNMLDPAADTWYIAGLRLTYPLSGLYTMSREKSINRISKKNIELQRDVFLFNTKLQTTRQEIEIQKIDDMIETDREIIELRESIKQSALAQLENGIITSADYVREVIAADQAQQSLILHEIQLLLAHYNHKLITGN